MRVMAPVNLIVYSPQTPGGRKMLAMRVSEAHASAVIERIRSLECPMGQKLALLDAIIDDVRRRSKQVTTEAPM